MRMKKKVLIAGIAIILAASAVVGYIWSQNQKKEQDYAKMEITFLASFLLHRMQQDRQPLLCKAFIW